MHIVEAHFWMSGIWAPPAITIIAKEFPMRYRIEPITSKELKSRVSGAIMTRVANVFPQEMLRAGRTKELMSKWGLES